MHKLLSIFIALLLMATSCGGSDAADEEAAAPEQETVVVQTEPLEVPGDSLGGISGELAFRERIAIEPGSSATISLVDVSLADAPSVLIAEETISTDNLAGSVKFGFGFAPELILDGRQYAVQAKVTNADGELTWINDTAYPVDFSDEKTADVGTVLVILIEQDAPAPTPTPAPSPESTPTTPAPTPTPAPAPSASVVGTWWVTAIDGQRPLAEPLASLIFDSAGQLSGSATCNSLSSTYTTSTGNTIKLGTVAVTQRACEEAVNQQEAAVLAVINDIASYKVDGNVLTLQTAGGKTLTLNTVKPAAPAPAPVVGTWTVTTIDGNAVIANSQATLVFNADGTLGGNASCNSYSTNFTIDGAKLSFGAVAITASLCDDPANQQETAMLAVLNNVSGYTISGNVLTLTAANGKTLTASR